jgi:hypothetical protein
LSASVAFTGRVLPAPRRVEALRNYRQPISIGRRGIFAVDRSSRRRNHLSRLRLDPEYYFIACR